MFIIFFLQSIISWFWLEIVRYLEKDYFHFVFNLAEAKTYKKSLGKTAFPPVTGWLSQSSPGFPDDSAWS